MTAAIKLTFQLISSKLDKKLKKRLAFITTGIFAISLLDLFAVWLLIQSVYMLDSEKKISNSALINFISKLTGTTKLEEEVFLLLLILMFVYLLKNIFSYIQTFIQNRLLGEIGSQTIAKQVDRYFNTEEMFDTEEHSSTIKNNIQSIPLLFVFQVLNPFITMMSEVFVLIMLILVIVFVNPVIALAVMLIMVPVSFFTYRALKNYMQRTQEVANDYLIKSNQYMDEMIFGFVDIKLNRKESFFYERIISSLSVVLGKYANYFTSDSLQPKIMEVTAISSILIIFCTSRFLNLGFSEASYFIMFFAGSAFRILPSINRILNSFLRINSHVFLVDEGLSGLSFRSKNHIAKTEPLFLKKRILLNDVSFRYKNRDKYILRHVNIEIKKGEITGLVGSSGSGKSTLVKLILGFITPTSGAIYCDDTELTAQQLNHWRKITNYVRQDFYLFYGNIAQNISMELDEKQIDLDRLNICIEKAQLKDFISALPEKEKTMIGEVGKSISEGQKQRIAIARAIYSNCEFLILDEATSSLDEATEEGILDTIYQLNNEGMTFLIIAHKPSTLRICHKIYTIHDGTVSISANQP